MVAIERIYIGGLDPSRLTGNEIINRLKLLNTIEIHTVDEKVGKPFIHLTAAVKADDGQNKDQGQEHEQEEEEGGRRRKRQKQHKKQQQQQQSVTALEIISKKYNNVKWKGCKLSVAAARPHFLQRLERERQEIKLQKENDKSIKLETTTGKNDEENLSASTKNSEKNKPQILSSDNGSISTNTTNIPRRLRVRKKFGNEAYHVDTKPWTVESWYNFSRAVGKGKQRTEKHIIKCKEAAAKDGVTLPPMMHRAVHIRFVDSASTKATADNRSDNLQKMSNMTSSSSSDNNRQVTISNNKVANRSSDSDDDSDSDTDDDSSSSGNINEQDDKVKAAADDDDDEEEDDDDDSDHQKIDKSNDKRSSYRWSDDSDSEPDSDDEPTKPNAKISEDTSDLIKSMEEEEEEEEEEEIPPKKSDVNEMLLRKNQSESLRGKYQWSSSSSSSSSDDGSDDDDDEGPKNMDSKIDTKNKNNLPFRTVPMNDEFSAGLDNLRRQQDDDDDDDEEKEKENHDDNDNDNNFFVGSNTSDLRADVDSNLAILSSLFPTLANTKPAIDDDDDDDDTDKDGSSTNDDGDDNEKHQDDILGKEGGDGGDENNTKSKDRKVVPKFISNEYLSYGSSSASANFMPRYDPTKESAQQFVVQDDAMENHDEKGKEETKKNMSRDDDENEADRDEDKDDDNDKSLSTRNDLKNQRKDDDDSKPGRYEDEEQVQVQENLYQEDKLESVFREARDAWHATTITNDDNENTNNVNSATTTPAATATATATAAAAPGAFSFGFDLGPVGEENNNGIINNNNDNNSTNKQTSGGAFTFSFEMPMNDNDDKVEKHSQNKMDTDDDDDKTTPMNNTSNTNINDDNGIYHEGFTVPGTILDKYKSLFFTINDGTRMLTDPEQFRSDDQVKQQWKDERYALTMDWKRKRKLAQSRIQKRIRK